MEKVLNSIEGALNPGDGGCSLRIGHGQRHPLTDPQRAATITLAMSEGEINRGDLH